MSYKNFETGLLKEERDFYESYHWALMPFLSFNQITEHLRHIVNEDLSSKPDWCRREWNINLYILSCAAADLVDDYLVRGLHNFSLIIEHVALMRGPVKFLQGMIMLNCRIRSTLRDGRVRTWRRQWSGWLNCVCEPLAMSQVPGVTEGKRFKDELIPLLDYPFPKSLMDKRMRIPAAYRSQDLTHHDVISLSDKYCKRHPDKELTYTVVGIRTAGSYFAPLVCAFIKKKGYKQVSHMTIRPKSIIHPFDRHHLKEIGQCNGHFILVDEAPNTGKTIIRCTEILKNFGVDSEKIGIMVPTHPAKRNWLDVSLKHSLGSAEIICLDPEEWYKEKLLDREDFRNTLMPYFIQMGFHDIEVKETEYTKKISNELMQNAAGEYHVRLKKVFQVIPKNKLGSQDSFLTMAKSVGWGWLGYHAALAASRLSGFIPSVYGIREGIMYLDWVKRAKKSEQKQGGQNGIVERLSAYISQRTNQLRLGENPTSFLSGYHDSRLQPLAVTLGKAFGAKVSTLKRGWVRNQLKSLSCPVPTLLDSRMKKSEWIDSELGLLKTDFEHHGFSKTASHNIVDPAYDIAVTMLEFGLSERGKDDLINSYIRDTGDVSVSNRVFFYKLLSGSEAMSESISRLNMPAYCTLYPELNRRYIHSWNFVVSETMRYSAQFCEGQPVRCWGEPMFVMDIDDVLDKNIFGFPSTTAKGIHSISLLREHGVCSVINTARSLEEVKDYCRHYGFAGGIAEYGSILWDDIEQQDEVLISPAAIDELAVLQDALEKIPGVFINPLYKYSIRAYSFDRERTIPVADISINEVFNRLGIKHLTAHRTYLDTAIYASYVDKGKSLLRLKELKGMNNGKIGAVGDTEADFPMLIVADQGFLVNNSAAELKSKAGHHGISIVKSSYQSGLFDAVDSFLHGGRGKYCVKCKSTLKKFKHKTDPFWRILQVADMSRLQHWFRAFDRNIFEVFEE